MAAVRKTHGSLFERFGIVDRIFVAGGSPTVAHVLVSPESLQRHLWPLSYFVAA